jgi:integrase/recombinase XerC
MKSLQAWRELRDSAEYAQQSPALFISATGARLSPRTVQARLRTLAMRAGLPTHVHPHMMRHSFASHVLQSSQDLRAVQEMLGHASIASTQIYTSLDFQHLAQAYDKAHPRAKAGKG